MSFCLRDVDPSRDFPRIAELLSAGEPEPVPEAMLHDRERLRPEGEVRCRFIAGEGDRSLGYGHATWRPGHRPGRFWLRLAVDPAARGRGIGGALYAALHRFAGAEGAGELVAMVRENRPEAIGFAERRGFAIERHLFESALAVPAFDASRFAGAVEAAQAQGIRFFSFADLPGTVEDRRRLYELNTTTARDVPGADPEEERSFEQFQLDVFEAYWFRPEGQIIAADGDRWIGLGAISETRPGVMYNAFTDVLREYRGRGIALALKLLGIECARRRGARSIRTHNDSANTAMLHVNRRLGYRPEPGYYRMVGSLARER